MCALAKIAAFAGVLRAAYSAPLPPVVVDASLAPVLLPVGLQDLNAYTEIPLTILKLPPSSNPACPWGNTPVSAFFISTSWSTLCIGSYDGYPLPAPPYFNVSPPELTFFPTTCSNASVGESYSVLPDQIPANTDWRRDYQGVFSTAIVNFTMEDSDASGGLNGAYTFMAVHGENKNELLYSTEAYQNTVNTDVTVSECYSGNHNGTYTDCWPAYNGFVSAKLAPYQDANCYGVGPTFNATYVDLGPVAWPLTGYLNSTGGKMTYGLRHPSTFVDDDGSVYVFYLENFLTGAWFYAVKAGNTGAGLGAFMAYNANSQDWDLPALPDGFDPLNVSASFASTPPNADLRQQMFFMSEFESGVHLHVAKLTDQPYYIAVYSSIDYAKCWNGTDMGESGKRVHAHTSPVGCAVPTYQVSIRISADLATWSNATILDAYSAGGWGPGQLHYPKFVSGDGTSESRIASTGFWISGTCSDGLACAQADHLGPTVMLAAVAVTLG